MINICFPSGSGGDGGLEGEPTPEFNLSIRELSFFPESEIHHNFINLRSVTPQKSEIQNAALKDKLPSKGHPLENIEGTHASPGEVLRR